MRESYVHPPLIAREAPSKALAIWRYRVIALIVLIALITFVVMALIKFLGIGNEDPGFGGALAQLHRVGR